ncbi:MAG: DEAD/DEAH box helicase [Parachlamydiales bacterium]|jgi:SNF2 family DNA or RNA helicase
MEFEKKINSFDPFARKLMENIRDIIFSDNNYEIEIYDPKDQTSYWPFLQIDDENNILDVFCSCKTHEKQGFCPHLSAAFLKITEKNEPIHVRFKKSFWHALLKIACEELGFDSNVLIKKKNGSYFFISETKNELFSIEADDTAIEKLEGLFQERKSQLGAFKNPDSSFYQMNLLKKHIAYDQLKFELSFFSDIAKWFFLMQDQNLNYKIGFVEKKDGIFSKVQVLFDNVEAKVFIPFESLNDLIPTLSSVKSSLRLFEYQGQEISKIIYVPEKVMFYIEKTKGISKADLDKHIGKKIGEYIYVEDVGFYPIEPDELLHEDIIQKDRISYFLKKYIHVFEKKLQNVKIFTQPVIPQYFLYFDENENLIINTYLFDDTDFEKPNSCFFNSWVYIQDKGFFCLENEVFDEPKKIISRENVSDFITKHKIWLHNFEGFQTHFGSIESHLVFTFTINEEIVFSSKIDFPDELENFIDFDDWVYIKGLGFFSKKERSLGLPIRPGLVIKKNEISKFIENHKEELEQVEGFFTNEMPIEKMGLEIFINDDLKIVIKPQVKLKEGYDIAKLHFFDKFIYLENKGFIEIPKSFSLPSRYDHENVLTNAEMDFFITYELFRLSPYIVSIPDSLKKPSFLNLKLIKIFKRKRKNKTIWLIDLAYESEIGMVHASEIHKAVLENKKYVFSSAGLIFLKHPRFNWLKNLKKSKSVLKDNLLNLTTLDIIRLFLLEDVKITGIHAKEAVQTKKLLEDLKTFQTDKSYDLSLLNSNLRSYQTIGIKWLWFLYVNNLSGLLCDDMGLGKTHQSMALIAAAYKANPSKYLVVCPTSVIYHWEGLLNKFLPALKVYIYHGLQRDLKEFEEGYDILLTSYGIIRQEANNLKKLNFDIAIFDEIQIAKNINSLTNKSLKLIDANMILGLSGTPIENYLIELKAIFDVVLPTYFPPDAIFKEFFINPIEKENDVERKKLLKKLISPFILRRMKKDVLPDLPEKIEEIAYVDLSEEQKKIYNEIVFKSKETILKDLQDENKPVQYVHIFSLLAKLKQICDHPSLILKDIDDYSKHESGKFELFIELLNEAKESNQKVVVFSQYLNMIKIIEEYFKKKNIDYAVITGATKKRFLEIKRFKEDPNCQVFIASLLAAGVGIDLSNASIVIHYDRWWNPAKENQATDRVHRIGQNRGVQVFKLVSKNTIEEHIHNIIEKKKYLIEETIGKDEVDQIKTLTREELIDILSQIQS